MDYVIVGTGYLTLCAVLLMILIVFIIQSYQYAISVGSVEPEFKLVRNLLILMLISEITGNTLFGVFVLDEPSERINERDILPIVHNVLTLTQVLWLIFQFCRLYYTFKTTAYALSKITIYGLIIMIIIASACLFISYAFGQIENTFPLALISYLLTLLVVTVISVMFCVKLLKLTLTMRQSFSTTAVSSPGKTDLVLQVNVEITDRQLQLLNVITKQALVNVGGTLMFFYLVITNLANIYQVDIGLQFLYLFLDFVWILCVWLSFSLTQKQYQIFCGCFHKCILNLLVNQVQKRIVKTNHA